MHRQQVQQVQPTIVVRGDVPDAMVEYARKKLVALVAERAHRR